MVNKPKIKLMDFDRNNVIIEIIGNTTYYMSYDILNYD